jgi:hypothetical protein
VVQRVTDAQILTFGDLHDYMTGLNLPKIAKKESARCRKVRVGNTFVEEEEGP